MTADLMGFPRASPYVYAATHLSPVAEPRHPDHTGVALWMAGLSASWPHSATSETPCISRSMRVTCGSSQTMSHSLARQHPAGCNPRSCSCSATLCKKRPTKQLDVFHSASPARPSQPSLAVGVG